MSSVANASIDFIQKFKGENADLSYDLNEVRSAAWNAISHLKSECESKLKAYSDMAKEADELFAKAKGKKSDQDKQASAAAENMAAQAENLRNYFNSQYVKIQQMMKSLDRFDSELYPMIVKAISEVQNADDCLQAAINAITEYQSYNIK